MRGYPVAMLGDSFHATDLAALGFFVAAWTLFSQATSGRVVKRPSLTSLMNEQREAWLRTMSRRELRMIDTSIMMGLQQGTAFFASSALIALGGCFALLQASDAVMSTLSDLSWTAAPVRAAYELKVLGLMVILAYTFFKFGWAYRLFNYCSILIGAVPMAKEEADAGSIGACLERATRMNVVAGKHFNAGLRGLFFSIGYLGWFVGPLVLVATTLFILVVLIRRQFYSDARAALLPRSGER